MPSAWRRVGIGAAALVGVYAIILGALLTPNLQRFALYAHKINTLFLHDIDNGERFGFAKGQVTPFSIHTADGETLYAWHVLPIDAYARNEEVLRKEAGSIGDFSNTHAFHLLTSSEAKVVVSFHGNAGHIAQGWRPETLRHLTAQPNTHVVTIDYRGFGKSSGYPTEAGLIEDGTALVNWVLRIANIPPNQIAILGQSLGTAVASAVALRFADPSNELVWPNAAEPIPGVVEKDGLQPTIFAGIILIAPFSSLPSLLLTYRMGGFLPLLLPLRPFPALASSLTSQMVDKWHTAERLRAYHATLSGDSGLAPANAARLGSLQIFHSLDDFDISYHQTEMICRRIFVDGAECIDGSKGAAVLGVKSDDAPRVRFELLQHGGETKSHVIRPSIH
ncbi:Alpha/Beta hydrolase protein [Neohortaea acidophila]|uniref:Alpha/Beta hydrolase protein n=1 Tax=Neohortaea acidophila TaxID=245834 RepID=A0A6A6Q377_9PEZI|nr:Alpha/Beta hydrolase protein [Neohortaea acidophila]KAF2486745.1 Alpha/Beta hydrolase protein [Neohortaea acidophila]